jgi:hypothetical protein
MNEWLFACDSSTCCSFSSGGCCLLVTDLCFLTPLTVFVAECAASSAGTSHSGLGPVVPRVDDLNWCAASSSNKSICLCVSVEQRLSVCLGCCTRVPSLSRPLTKSSPSDVITEESQSRWVRRSSSQQKGCVEMAAEQRSSGVSSAKLECCRTQTGQPCLKWATRR